MSKAVEVIKVVFATKRDIIDSSLRTLVIQYNIAIAAICKGENPVTPRAQFSSPAVGRPARRRERRRAAPRRRGIKIGPVESLDFPPLTFIQ